MEIKDIDFFKKQMESLINKARFGSVSLTTFLDEAKQAILLGMNTSGIDLSFNGGFINAENKRAMLKPIDYEVDDYKINIYEIIYNERYLTLNHRNILGTLMSLGIKRESIGDIYVNDNKAYFACTNEISKYVEANFKMIGHHSVELRLLDDKIKIERKKIEKTFIVSSMRLDVIIAAAYKFSRNEANEFINAGLVSINHIACLNNSMIVKVNDVISVRHKGRVYVNEISGKTRSERLAIKLGFLV